MDVIRLQGKFHLSSLYTQETHRDDKTEEPQQNAITENKLTVWQSTSLKTLVVQMMNMMEAVDTK